MFKYLTEHLKKILIEMDGWDFNDEVPPEEMEKLRQGHYDVNKDSMDRIVKNLAKGKLVGDQLRKNTFTPTQIVNHEINGQLGGELIGQSSKTHPSTLHWLLTQQKTWANHRNEHAMNALLENPNTATETLAHPEVQNFLDADTSGYYHSKVGEHPNTKGDLLDHYINSDNLTYVTRNPNLEDHHIETIFNKTKDLNYSSPLYNLATNPALSHERQKQLYGMHNFHYVLPLARNNNLSPELQKHLSNYHIMKGLHDKFKYVDPKGIATFLINGSPTAETLHNILMTYPDDQAHPEFNTFLHDIVRDPITGTNSLEKLSKHPLPEIRKRAAMHPNTDLGTLHNLAKDKEPDVAKTARRRLGIK